MFELVFLGTAAGVPAVDRGLPALMVVYGGRRFLIDCGEGTQRQLLASGLGFRRLERVLLTHGHLDHLLGLGGLAGTLALLGAARRLEVHGGKDALRALRHLLEDVVWPGAEPPLQIDLLPLAPGVVFEERGLRIRAFAVEHREADAFGFRFEETPRRAMRQDRLSALGVPSGPERARLAAGESVVLGDGRRIAPDDVLGPPCPGAVLVVLGDVARTRGLEADVGGADALVIEATFLERHAGKAAARGHLTAAGAARLARDAGVGALYLSHLSARYTEAEIEAEAKEVFPAARAVRDFDRIAVRAPPARAG